MCIVKRYSFKFLVCFLDHNGQKKNTAEASNTNDIWRQWNGDNEMISKCKLYSVYNAKTQSCIHAALIDSNARVKYTTHIKKKIIQDDNFCLSPIWRYTKKCKNHSTYIPSQEGIVLSFLSFLMHTMNTKLLCSPNFPCPSILYYCVWYFPALPRQWPLMTIRENFHFMHGSWLSV